MELETRREAPPVARSARNVLPYVRTQRSERWRIAPRIRRKESLFQRSA